MSLYIKHVFNINIYLKYISIYKHKYIIYILKHLSTYKICIIQYTFNISIPRVAFDIYIYILYKKLYNIYYIYIFLVLYIYISVYIYLYIFIDIQREAFGIYIYIIFFEYIYIYFFIYLLQRLMQTERDIRGHGVCVCVFICKKSII